LLYSSIVGYDSLAITSLGRGISIYGGLFHSTAITHSFDIFINLVSGIIIGLTAFNPRYLKTAKPLNLKLGHYNTDKDKLIKKGEGYSIIEYPLLLLFIVLGATFLMSSSDLVSMFLSIELQSYGLYIFATLYRNSELATSAGLSYFLLGGLSSCLILLGSTLLYINSGLTNLDGIYILASFFENKEIESLFTDVESFNKGQYFNISLIILSVGYLFKVAAAPFHF
jgi:NADH-ubiquinone oxidoreductase chain 2